MEDKAESLASYCLGRTSGELRSVFTYTTEGGEVVYLRDDVAEERARDSFEGLMRGALAVHRGTEEVRHESPETSLGHYEALIHLFENAYAFQFPLDENRGFIASFDKEIGQELHGFAQQCQQAIEEGGK